MMSVIADMHTYTRWTLQAFAMFAVAHLYSEVAQTSIYNAVFDLVVVLCVAALLRIKSPRKLVSHNKPLKGLSRKASGNVQKQTPPIRETREPNTRVQINHAIHKAARAGDREQAQTLLAEMESAGLKPDTDTYHSLLHACARCGDVEGAEYWCSKMQAQGGQVTVYTYNILMDCYAKADDPVSAEAWMERLQTSGLKGNNVSYSTLIHAHARLGNIQQARAWLAKMVKEGVEPNIVTYNSLIHAYSRAGDAAGAESILMEVLSCGCTPEVTTYTAIIDACKKSSDVARAEKVMMEMHRNGVKANVVTYSAMIDVCCKANQPEEAVRWFESMTSAGVRPNTVSFNALISACSKDPIRCRKAYEQMDAQGVPPDIVTFTSLAAPYAQKGEWESVEKLQAEMQARGIVANDYFLYTLLMAYGKSRPRQPHRAEAAFRSLVAIGVQPNKHVARVLCNAMGSRAGKDLLTECGGRALADQCLAAN